MTRTAAASSTGKDVESGVHADRVTRPAHSHSKRKSNRKTARSERSIRQTIYRERHMKRSRRRHQEFVRGGSEDMNSEEKCADPVFEPRDVVGSAFGVHVEKKKNNIVKQQTRSKRRRHDESKSFLVVLLPVFRDDYAGSGITSRPLNIYLLTFSS